jgi:hypothetical protein
MLRDSAFSGQSVKSSFQSFPHQAQQRVSKGTGIKTIFTPLLLPGLNNTKSDK